jgi:integrase/recombinase XerD
MRLQDCIYGTGLDTIIKPVPKIIKTKIVLRDYVNSEGKSLLYLHAHYNNKRWKHALGIYVFPKDWDQQKMRIKKPCLNFRDYNLVLDNVSSQVTVIRTNYRLMGKPLDLEMFKKEMLYGVPRVSFIAYMEYRLKMKNIGAGTKRRYESIVKKVKAWKPELVFHQIDHNFPDSYRKYYSEKGNKKSTLESNCKFIKEILIAAKKDDIYFPLDIDDFKITSYRSTREYLLPQEMKRMFAYYNNEFILPMHKLALGYYLISCVTGLRVSEVMMLRRNSLKNEMAQIYAPKTGKKTTIYQTSEMKQLLSSCPDLCEKWPHENTINKYLKVIARTVGITKTVSMHVGRHTFAMAYLRVGGDIRVLKTILKHSKMDTTMIYVHQLDEEQAANTDAVGSLYH